MTKFIFDPPGLKNMKLPVPHYKTIIGGLGTVNPSGCFVFNAHDVVLDRPSI